MLYKEKSAGIAPTISPLDVNVYGPVPILDVEALYWCLRHHPGIVNHDVDPPDPLHSGIDQSLHLIVLRDIGR